MEIEQDRNDIIRIRNKFENIITNSIKETSKGIIFHNVCVIKGGLDLILQKMDEIIYTQTKLQEVKK